MSPLYLFGCLGAIGALFLGVVIAEWLIAAPLYYMLMFAPDWLVNGIRIAFPFGFVTLVFRIVSHLKQDPGVINRPMFSKEKRDPWER